jgi:CBS domain-containing protein
VNEFVREHVLRRGRRALLVTDGRTLLGIASITDVKELPQDRWHATAIADIMTPVPLKTATPEQHVASVLKLMVEQELNQVPVVVDRTVAGMLSRADILRFLQLRDELAFSARAGVRETTRQLSGAGSSR